MLIHSNSWIFQDAVTTAGNGSVFYSGPNDQLTVYITGTSSNFNVVFEGCDNNDNWYPLPAIKLPDLTTVSSTTSKGAYVLNLAQWVGIRCRVSAVSGGTLSIIGRIVNSGTSLISNKDVQLTGSTLAEQKTQVNAVNNVITFSANITAIEIYHEESIWQTFTVNGLNIVVPAGGYRTPVGGTPGATVTIPVINCLVGRLV